MILEQFYLGCLAHASYLVADEQTGTALVVDPQRDIDRYLEFAQAHHLRIDRVVLTHFHADFVAGHLELRDRTGARIYLGRTARAEYAFTPVGDGDAIAFGRVRIDILETPGHTAESISLVVYDLDAAGGAPVAVLTGDTLFVGDVGRPDLRVALGWSATQLGGMLYDSLHEKVLALPDPTLVYPAHGAGSLCGKAIRRETVSTIGMERRTNYALQPMAREAFIDLVAADQPDAPAYFTYDAVLNTKERPTLADALARELASLPLSDVLALRAGAVLLDTREANDFASAHFVGSLNIGLGGQYATWAGTLLPRESPVVIIAEPGREEESAIRLARIGFDQVAGYLQGGMLALAGRPDLTASTLRVSAPVAAGRARQEPPALLVDVRTPAEQASKAIAGSLAIPLNRLPDHLEVVPRDRPLLVYCAGGYRSSIAASVLQRAGFPDVSEIAGGINAWEAAGLPMETAGG